jgi:DHA2 family multidrug resistance protein-like MFS transporter
MALGIAILGSIIAAVYRGLAIPPGTPDAVASHARESLTAAVDASGRLPADNAHFLLTAAKDAFTEGLAIAAGVGSALLLVSAVAVWLLLKPRPVPPPLAVAAIGR